MIPLIDFFVQVACLNPNFAEGELIIQGIQAKIIIPPKQMHWEPSKIKDFYKILDG
jgi:hypothetical protein